MIIMAPAAISVISSLVLCAERIALFSYFSLSSEQQQIMAKVRSKSEGSWKEA
jgi:hypothetical protein